jgi:hypothetical protein
MDNCMLRVPVRKVGLVGLFFVLFSLTILCGLPELVGGSFVMATGVLIVLESF